MYEIYQRFKLIPSCFGGLVNLQSGQVTRGRCNFRFFHRNFFVTANRYPFSDLTSNYCRNPSDDIRPWCFTTDSGIKWEYCGIPKCTGGKYKNVYIQYMYKPKLERIIVH